MRRTKRKAARNLQADLRRLQANVEGAAGEAERVVLATVAAQPLLAVGAAAGVGFLIGGGLPRGAITMLLGVGARMAGAWLQQEFLEHRDDQE